MFKEQLTNSSNGIGILAQNQLWWWQKNQKQFIDLPDIIGISKGDETSEYAVFVVSSCPFKKSYLRKPTRRFRESYFYCSSIAVRDRWLEALSQQLYPSIQHPQNRHLYILINPYSGQKKARRIFQKIEPLLQKSDLQYTLRETQGKNDIKEQINALDFSKIDGIVVVGGDGTVHEVVNSLVEHRDRQTALKIPLGIIPAGTGNGLCKSLLELSQEPYNLLSAVFLIIQGQYHVIDIGLVQQNLQSCHSVLSVSWGLPSIVDIDSEKLRYLGSLRNVIYGLWQIIWLRFYLGKLSLNFPPSTITNLPSQQIITGEFVLLWVMNSPWATFDLKIAPLASLNDNLIDVIAIRKGISRLKLLWAFLLLYITQKKHINLVEVEYYQVQSFDFEPLNDDSYLTIDGEIARNSFLKFTLQPSLVNFFANPRLPVHQSNLIRSQD
ncbi:MAG: diacylglycerol kinase family protein [Jaaginema sp. PMC 1080.18]|nr:diacylglycerol kinase family protein [Jaaginema sp. PMC 1080.18]MEC4867761.1 diacylglycerol kinase family protein [Jaaginema sp. PMC 1078.18]